VDGSGGVGWLGVQKVVKEPGEIGALRLEQKGRGWGHKLTLS